MEILEEKIKSAGNIRLIIDDTEKYFDYQRLKEAYQGRLLQKYISSFEGCDTEVEKRALAYGTEAILEALAVW